MGGHGQKTYSSRTVPIASGNLKSNKIFFLQLCLCIPKTFAFWP